MPRRLLVGLTSYQDFSYTAKAIRSALRTTTEDDFVLVVDDASPDWPRDGLPAEFAEFRGDVDPTRSGKLSGRVGFVQFGDNYGLTRSMNKVVEIAAHAGFEYCCVSNNDVVFTTGWWDHLQAGLDAGYDLVGPVSNAPGPTAGGLQEVDRWLGETMALTDDEEQLDAVAARLAVHAGRQVETRVNGFCFAARTEDWIDTAYAEGEVFKLEVTHNSRGQRNPTPRATLMEDFYQRRLYEAGGKAAVCPASFVFHYRSVSRGDRYKQGRWYRPEPGK